MSKSVKLKRSVLAAVGGGERQCGTALERVRASLAITAAPLQAGPTDLGWPGRARQPHTPLAGAHEKGGAPAAG